MEVVIQCSVDQIEQLTPLQIDLQAAGIRDRSGGDRGPSGRQLAVA